MSDGEWAYQDDDGNKLILAACHDDELTGGGHVHADMTGAGPVCIPPGDWPQIIAAAYEKVGLPAPVILDRSGYDTRSETRIGAFTLWREDGHARVNMAFGGCTLDSAEARHLAAAIVAYADDLQPDPAEVTELAELIFAEVYRGNHSAQDAAKAILRLGYSKQQEASRV